MAGGGIGAMVVDMAGGLDAAGRAAMVDRLRKWTAPPPILLWSETADPDLEAFVVAAGAQGCLTPDVSAAQVSALLAVKHEGRREAAPAAARSRRGGGTIVAVMGVKGGVGTTTVAMNVAATLSGRGEVVLAEIRPSFGTLRPYFQPDRTIRGFPSRREVATHSGEAVVRLLWPVRNVPGLRVLFGPQGPEDCREIEGETAAELVATLAGEADFVVVDLPPLLTATNAAILAASDHLALVLEATACCSDLGTMMLAGLRSGEAAPPSVGAVIVKQSPDRLPLPPAEIEAELGIPVYAVVPPSQELCLRGERSRIPMVLCGDDSLARESFTELASQFRHTSRNGIGLIRRVG